MVLCWYVEELNGWVGIFMYRYYGASRAAFGELVIEGWAVSWFVVSKRLSPNSFDVAVFSFCQCNDVWV